jgi:glycosyltransferase involved in cell wall biosynthesis
MLINQIWKNEKLLKSGVPLIQTNSKARKINSKLVVMVGMFNSPHFQTWVRAFQGEFPNRQLVLFPSDRPIQEIFSDRKLTSGHSHTRLWKISPFHKINFYLYALLDKTLGLRWRAFFLGLLLANKRPAVIHFHEMQHGAYIFNLLMGYRRISTDIRKIISTWGSDLTLYSWTDSHQSNLRTCLGWANTVTAEKVGEELDALRLGFRGDFRAPVYIHIGRPPRDQFDFEVPSARKKILVKGYQTNPGRALNALYVLSSLGELLKDYEVCVYSATESVLVQIDILRNREGLNIKEVSLSHGEMQDLFKSARISIGLSESDGLPAAFIESIYAGAFPIQSGNSAVSKFVNHGKSGFLVQAWDLDNLATYIRKALSDDHLVDTAAEENRKILNRKYDINQGRENLNKLYI